MGPYDSLWQIAPCLTEIYSSLKFCQPVIFGDFLSDTDEFLSHFIEFLSNTQGYLDSLLFCQCPQSCLTELLVCLTEFRLGLTELPKNVKTEIFLQKLLVLIKILKNPRDRSHEMQFKKLCQEDFTIGPLLRVVFGKNIF